MSTEAPQVNDRRAKLEPIPNPHPDAVYTVDIETSEFTCNCPRTGQPDFATLYLSYVPGPSIVELKSLKMYLWTFRTEGHFHEDVTNMIANDLEATLAPRYLKLKAAFNIRGGITTAVTVERGERPA